MIHRRSTSRVLGQNAEPEDTTNPLEFVANISDVMLVLAVALMCALIAHWGLSIKNTVALDESKLEQVEVELTEEDLNQTSDTGDHKYKKRGSVFQDITTGDMYIVQQ